MGVVRETSPLYSLPGEGKEKAQGRKELILISAFQTNIKNLGREELSIGIYFVPTLEGKRNLFLCS